MLPTCKFNVLCSFVDKIKSPIPFANNTKPHVYNVRTKKLKRMHVMLTQMRL